MAKSRGNTFTFYTNGKRADDRYGLSKRVGQIVKKVDAAAKKAAVSTSRKVQPIAKDAIATAFGIQKSKLNDKFRVAVKPESLKISASTRKFSLVEFRGRWTGRKSPGASAEIVLGSRRVYTSAFIAPGRLRGQETKLIYSRNGKKAVQKYGRYKGKLRESIKAARGPSPSEMLADTRQGDGIRQTVTRLLVAFHSSELRRLIALDKS